MNNIYWQQRIQQFEKKKKKKKKFLPTVDTHNGVYISIVLLFLIGLILVFTSSTYYALYEHGTLWFFIKKQALLGGVGFIAMRIIARVDYHKWRIWTLPLAGITLILLVAVLILGQEILGAKRWLDFGGISLQPSEIAKYAVVFILADIIIKLGKNINTFKRGIMMPLFVAGIFAGLVYLEKNLSITVVICLVAYLMLIVGGANIKHMLSMIPIAFGGVVLMIIDEPYRLVRVTTFLNPWAHQSEGGYQLSHSLMAIASGGVFGQGLGNSMQKALYMPEPYNDFIFAILAEEFGLIGCIFVIGIFVLFILSSLKVATRAKDKYGRLLASGITFVIAIQAIINIAVVTGSMPVTGVPLPFISSGGTSLLINLAAMGVLLNISKQSKKELSSE